MAKRKTTSKVPATIKVVSQEQKMGCGIACVASVKGATYRGAKRWFKDLHGCECCHGYMPEAMVIALGKAGLSYRACKTRRSKEISKDDEKKDSDDRWSRIKKGDITVRPGDILLVWLDDGDKHFIVRIDEKRWMDPKLQRPYTGMPNERKGWQSSIPTHVIRQV